MISEFRRLRVKSHCANSCCKVDPFSQHGSLLSASGASEVFSLCPPTRYLSHPQTVCWLLNGQTVCTNLRATCWPRAVSASKPYLRRDRSESGQRWKFRPSASSATRICPTLRSRKATPELFLRAAMYPQEDRFESLVVGSSFPTVSGSSLLAFTFASILGASRISRQAVCGGGPFQPRCFPRSGYLGSRDPARSAN